MSDDKAFYAIVKTHKRRSNKIYTSELIMTKIENWVKVLGRYIENKVDFYCRVDLVKLKVN